MKVFKGVKAWIEDSEGRVLFLKEKRPSGKEYYSLPGGRLDDGESEEEGLKRELVEETNLEIQIIKPLGEYSFTMESGNEVEVKVFQCKAEGSPSGKNHNPSYDEGIDSFHWIKPQEFLDNKLVPAGEDFNRFLKEILQ